MIYVTRYICSLFCSIKILRCDFSLYLWISAFTKPIFTIYLLKIDQVFPGILSMIIFVTAIPA